MSLPGNGIFVVRGELTTLMTGMRRGARWSHSSSQDDTDTLMRNFQELREIVSNVEDLSLVPTHIYFAPFLEVIRSEETTGLVTSLALSSVDKFLKYGLIDAGAAGAVATVHAIADAVTHARFVGTDQSSDGVVLMRIVQVLRTLTLGAEGPMLTNESLCEIMLSCFRICFETRLNELLRRTAEHTLKDMVQLMFMRLPQFVEDSRSTKQLKMRPGAIDHRPKRKSFRLRRESVEESNHVVEKGTGSGTGTELRTASGTVASGTTSPHLKVHQQHRSVPLSTTPQTPSSGGNIVDMQGAISQSSPENGSVAESPSTFDGGEKTVEITVDPASPEEPAHGQNGDEQTPPSQSVQLPELTTQTLPPLPPGLQDSDHNQEYVNERGIRFTPHAPSVGDAANDETVLVPHGLACVRELFRFLISLCNPYDKQNTDVMVHLGLVLLTVAFEVGADSIGKYQGLLALVKDDMCRNLFALLSSERLSVFAADLQLCFLLFESLRTHLKYQLEFYLTRLIDIIVTDSGKITYEHKETALDNILQLWRIPGFVTELYLNYDCDMYCTNLYEDLTKLLAKNALSATVGVYHTHALSLDALLTVIEAIKKRGEKKLDLERMTSDGGKARVKWSECVPDKEQLMASKSIKRCLPTGTDHFNHKPKKGIQFLQEHGFFKGDEADPQEIAVFLRENSNVDKKMIGEYLGSRGNVAILDAFLRTFDFAGQRIDVALRQYLESFRLPGEAPIISHLMEHFAEHWHTSNGEPFADVDAAFTLAYAVIILNVDQHNQNAKKQKTPMSLQGFKKNLKGVNGGQDFEEEMLEDIYHAIRTDEIIMPAEQTGLVRENYLWKVLLRKGSTKHGLYYSTVNSYCEYDAELFAIIWVPITTALSCLFDKSDEAHIYRRALNGFLCCARISASFGICQNVDALTGTLAKFSGLSHAQQQSPPSLQAVNTNTNYRATIVAFGAAVKSREALKTMCAVFHQHGDFVRDGWQHLFDILLTLYRSAILPKMYVDCEDFTTPGGKIQLVYRDLDVQKQDVGLLSSLYSYMVSGDVRAPSQEEQQCMEQARETIAECALDLCVTDSKFLNDSALTALTDRLMELSRGPEVQKTPESTYNESVAVFYLELLVKIVLQNKDRVLTIWRQVHDHLYTTMMNASLFDYQFLLQRSVIGLLRIAIRLMRNEDMSPIVIQSLRMLLLLKPAILNRISRQISYGLYELLKTSAQNIHTRSDWTIVFTLLECVGAGACPPKPSTANQREEEGGESVPGGENAPLIGGSGGIVSGAMAVGGATTGVGVGGGGAGGGGGSPSGGWILVGAEEGEIVGRTMPANQYGLALDRQLGEHDASSLMKCCESLAFLVRDVAHITPYNFDDCVHCIRTFVEASLHGTKRTKRKQRGHVREKRKSPVTSDSDGSEEEELPNGYHQISIQLLDLMHTLHTRTAQIFKWWAEENGALAQDTSLWTQGWCPLLQGIARLCCDVRREIRMSAITYLQRALLVHDLQTLSGPEWEECFNRVLFPLLAYLLQPLCPRDPHAMEETRMRAATVLSKVFLHHLTPLLSLPTFADLWLTILDFTEKYMHAEPRSDLLQEAIPESLKNMLLVMESAGVFEGADRGRLWALSREKIGAFLPGIREELFKDDVAAVEGATVLETKQQGQETRHQMLETKHPMQEAKHPMQETKQQPLQDKLEDTVPGLDKDKVGAQPVRERETAEVRLASTSIILQGVNSVGSPTAGQVSSHLFAHLGQMVSTPIVSPPPAPPFIETPPTLKNPTHTFPILYSSPVIPTTQTTEVQPVSLYAEYLVNPYNNENAPLFDVNKNNDPVSQQQAPNNNLLANYFATSDPDGRSDFIPVAPSDSDVNIH